MILLTVGTQLPFDRLVRAVDDWAGGNEDVAIFGQIGPSSYRPKHFDTAEFLTPSELEAMTCEAELVISHAGMGSIFTALKFGKPIVVVPRKASLGEHRNDHQLATAKRFSGRSGITVVFESEELRKTLSRRSDLVGTKHFPLCASEQLISNLRNWFSATG